MVQSMTGFGSANNDTCKIEIRSLNHRFLEINIKTPPFLNYLDIQLRNILKKRFSRGKFDIIITITEQGNTELKINTDAAGKIYSAFKELKDELSIPGELDINTIANFREMFIEICQNYNKDLIIELFKKALEDLYEMRIKEGESLTGELCRMADLLEGMNEKIKLFSKAVVTEMKNKFNERIAMLLEGKDIDSNRLLQESALIAARYDISEEVFRLGSHLKQFREIVADGDIIGKKIDFIIQELNREVNTIASKSADYNITSLVVEMKAEIEMMREQAQNIQ